MDSQSLQPWSAAATSLPSLSYPLPYMLSWAQGIRCSCVGKSVCGCCGLLFRGTSLDLRSKIVREVFQISIQSPTSNVWLEKLRVKSTLSPAKCTCTMIQHSRLRYLRYPDFGIQNCAMHQDTQKCRFWDQGIITIYNYLSFLSSCHHLKKSSVQSCLRS